jgi:hypothetical protein
VCTEPSPSLVEHLAHATRELDRGERLAQQRPCDVAAGDDAIGLAPSFNAASPSGASSTLMKR